jgi:hypothetical protein
MQNVQAPKKTILKLSTRKAPKKKVMVSANVEGIDIVLSNNSLKQLFSRMTPMKTQPQQQQQLPRISRLSQNLTSPLLQKTDLSPMLTLSRIVMMKPLRPTQRANQLPPPDAGFVNADPPRHGRILTTQTSSKAARVRLSNRNL